MSASVLAAIRGPVLLITLGVLFAIDHAGSFPFTRTWPVLIVVFGLLKLLERVVAPEVPYTPPPPGPFTYAPPSYPPGTTYPGGPTYPSSPTTGEGNPS